MILKILGLGMVQGWMWLFFMNGPLLYRVSVKGGVNPDRVFILFMVSTVLAYLLLARAGERLSPLKHRVRFLTIALLPCTFLLFAGTTDAGSSSAVLFFAAIVSGIGSAVLITAWGEIFTMLPVGQTGFSFAGAVGVGTAVFFMLSNIRLIIAMPITSVLPLLSLVCWYLDAGRTSSGQAVRGELREPDEPVEPGEPLKIAFPFPPRLVVLVVLIYAAGGLMYKTIALQANISAQQAYWLTNLVYLAICLVAGICIYFLPDLDLRYLYRPILPLLGSGFLLFPILNNSLSLVPFSLIQAGFALADMYTWMLIIYLAARSRVPAVVIGWGYFLITSCILLGTVSFTGIISNVSFTSGQINSVSMIATLLMLAGTLIFSEQRETFSGWETNGGKAATDVNAPPPQERSLCEAEPAAAPVVPVSEPSAAAAPFSAPGGMAENGRSVYQFMEQYDLTHREKEVLLLLLKGRNNPYVREKLNISNNTVKSHLRNIYQKMGVDNRQTILNLFGEFYEATNKPQST